MQRWLRMIGFWAAAAVMLAGCSFPMAASGSQVTFPSLVAVTIFPPVSNLARAAASTLPSGLPTANVPLTGTPVHIVIATPSPDSSQLQATISDASYVDDRSTGVSVVQSMFNAINLKEYLRAYSYWENTGSGANVPAFDQFQQGYQDTASVKVTFGVVGEDVGAGQIYYTVPVMLQAQSTNGEEQVFGGCYRLHQSRPDIQTAPPFQGLAIASGVLNQAAVGANTGDLLAQGCTAAGIPQTNPIGPQPATDSVTIAASNYLDDRSDPLEVLRSLFNAINRKEYVRAYSYWQDTATAGDLLAFLDFQKGYQDTASVEATFGNPTREAGAGNMDYSVPVVLKVQTTQGTAQAFAGCYTLHLAQPAIQGRPPFEPLGIRSANVNPVANETDTAGLLTAVCVSTP